ncbi:polymorphic toxin type 44 domain-containing protein [Pseudodesulfovibrio sp. zrk46]|uniref:polymorphic toxin type 44 domain-containing protein n=1 Tax=Pseudodesulfovibrio sp. zrk46 TaxID=2725288 RepID=UPI001449D8F2|nr:polymorphic toxin type 44 domain-containing protein [Pseudodesulfovibrio sp. zrk46]QJB57022.1 hypothetical protein HFN16_11700 [Pseudodesulfovibrio sp. zrk46]
MTRKRVQHIGGDQLVYGLPKHMSAVAGSGGTNDTNSEKATTYWRFKPKPHACEKCQAMKDVWFERKPAQIHPNCKCELEQFEAISTDASRDIVVPPGVDIEANLAEARRKAKECRNKADQIISALEAKVKRVINDFSLPDSLRKTSAEAVAFYLKCEWVYEKFQNDGKYDYKQIDKRYQAFGNYHYGLYTNAMKLNATFAQVAAGYAQFRAGTWEPEFYSTWLDDPADNGAIRKGQAYPVR